MIAWRGSTGVGYEAYDRTHTVSFPSLSIAGPTLTMSSDPAFRGDPALLNPEQLLLAAAGSCQLLSFLAVAARARLDVTAYDDAATAFMPEEDPPIRVTRMELRPRIQVRSAVPDARIQHLVALAHRECFIANSLTTSIEVTPTVVRSPGQ